MYVLLTGERPYMCVEQDCQRAFTTNYSRKSHMRVHRRNLDNKQQLKQEEQKLFQTPLQDTNENSSFNQAPYPAPAENEVRILELTIFLFDVMLYFSLI